MKDPLKLHVVMYHYVRDLPRTPYPQLKAMLLDDFPRQVDELAHRYEMATLESALDFLHGAYRPRRDLCLLTFDDGLKEHARDITPLLAERGIQGLFFVITGCLEEGVVAPVHMNHYLTAAMGFEPYRLEFLARAGVCDEVDRAAAQAIYQWDTPEVAAFKYLFNFVMDARCRDELVRHMFTAHFGPEDVFSRQLYLSWEEARDMQSAGMLIGGHSHRHRPLSNLCIEEMHADLRTCRALLEAHLRPQAIWPFSFPYGKKMTFNGPVLDELSRLGYSCAFTTEIGDNAPGTEPFVIRRMDCKDVRRGTCRPDRRAKASACAATVPRAAIGNPNGRA